MGKYWDKNIDLNVLKMRNLEPLALALGIIEEQDLIYIDTIDYSEYG